jgi:Tol biopolymer transport system component
VAFESFANNLVVGDGNVTADVFVHDRQTGATTRVSVDLDGVEGNGNSNNPSISADGSFVTFQSDADNLVAGDTNIAPDIFVDDLQAGAGGGGGGGSGCFISTAADGSRMAGEK